MPHSHSHSLGEAGAGAAEAAAAAAGLRSSPTARLVTLVLLALVAALTAFGMVSLWPDYAKVAQVADRVSYAAPGVTQQRGEILGVVEGCEDGTARNGAAQPGSPPPMEDGSAHGATSALSSCQTLSIGVRTGPDAGRVVEVTARGTLAISGLQKGDQVELSALPVEKLAGEGPAQQRAYSLANVYEATGVVRHLPLAILALAFVAVVIAVGRLRGLLALVALGVAGGVLLGFVLPALICGGPALLIGLVGSSAIMFATLYFVHGPNMRTTSALIGTLAGILIIAGVSWIAVHTTRLSGLGDEASGLLSGAAGEMDFRGLLTCSILIAGLGVLNDVTITQASSVWELRAAAPGMTRREIYARAMRIGRDHIASTVYTVFFAYAGAAISVLILLYLYNRPVLSLLTQEDIAIEIVRTFAGSIGLVLSVPITTWVAAMFVPPAVEEVSSPWRGRATGDADPLHS